MKSFSFAIVTGLLVMVSNSLHQANGSPLPLKTNQTHHVHFKNKILNVQHLRQDTAALPPSNPTVTTTGGTSKPPSSPQVSETPQGEAVNGTTPVTQAPPPIQEEVVDSEEDDKTLKPTPCENIEEVQEEDSSDEDSSDSSDSSSSVSYEEEDIEYFPEYIYEYEYEDGDYYAN